jgi:serine protease AprX
MKYGSLIAYSFLMASLALAGQPKISRDLESADPNSMIDVIVQFKQQPTARHFDKVRGKGGQLKHELGLVKGGAFRLPAIALRALADDPEVDYVAPDRQVRASSSSIIAETINAPIVWSFGHRGTGVGVAVIDSGIKADFKDFGDASGNTGTTSTGVSLDRVVYQEDFLVPVLRPDGTANPDRYKTHDQYGHGTHIAGIIAGNGFISQQLGSFRSLSGIAPNANLIDLQVLDQNGQGTDGNVIAAINQAINLKGKYNIRVINLSLGRSISVSFAKDPLCQAVEKAWKAGIVVVVAAGNGGRDTTYGGYGTIQVPGNDPLVITVGAMRTAGTTNRGDDEITTYSSRGPSLIDHVVKPDLVAPGNLIDSAMSDAYLPKTYPQNLVDPLSVYNPGAISK